MPIFLMGKTNVVYGKVIEIFPNKEVQSHSRKIKYAYNVNRIYYTGFKKLGTRDKRQAIGNDVRIIYSIKKPKRHKIEEIFNKHKNSKGHIYYSNRDSGFIELRLINGIFKYREFAKRGKIVNELVGNYEILDDSIKLKSYVFETEI